MDSYLYWCPKTIKMIYGDKSVNNKKKQEKSIGELKQIIKELKLENEKLKRILANNKQ